ncbi:hypothetical protein OG900_21710 [Streptomyces sp. NBC_00433]
MSFGFPRAPTLRVVEGYQLQAAGYEWDAVRVPSNIGQWALAALGESSGAVIEDPHERVLYWFVAQGATAEWDIPEIRLLGRAQYLVVPERGRLRGPGPHWHNGLEARVMLTNAAALCSALTIGVSAHRRICTGTQ